MKATLFSLIIAALLWYVGGVELPLNWMLPIAAVFVLTLPLLFAFSWGPLQKGEQNITPRLLGMFARDVKIHVSSALLLLFPLVTFAIWVFGQEASSEVKLYLSLGWIVLFGIALDLLWGLIIRITGYLDPFQASELIAKKASADVRKNNVENLIDGIDALAEVSSRSISRGNASLAQESIQELRNIGVEFLKASKSFANLTEDLDENTGGQVDKVAFTFFSLVSRLQSLGYQAAQKKMETVLSQTMTSLGRLAIASANYDLTLTAHPIVALGKIATHALKHHENETAIKGEIVLFEVAKSIINENDLSYGDLKSPFIALIHQLEALEESRFQADKDIQIQLLTQPFLDLKELFKQEKLVGHLDTPALLSETDRVLAEFAALENVLRAMPKIPDLEEA